MGAALQGLAGLRMTEALRLTWHRVDLERGLIEISGEVKNVYSTRVIPVCQRVLESLRGIANVDGTTGPVIRSPKGCSFAQGRRSWNNYSHRLSRAMREWNPQINWTPKDLRNCLPTFTLNQGIHSMVWEQYLGHSPKSVTARHYIPRITSVSDGEREALQKQMDLFRNQVIDPLEAMIQQDGEAKILNIFEHAINRADA